MDADCGLTAEADEPNAAVRLEPRLEARRIQAPAPGSNALVADDRQVELGLVRLDGDRLVPEGRAAAGAVFERSPAGSSAALAGHRDGRAGPADRVAGLVDVNLDAGRGLVHGRVGLSLRGAEGAGEKFGDTGDPLRRSGQLECGEKRRGDESEENDHALRRGRPRRGRAAGRSRAPSRSPQSWKVGHVPPRTAFRAR